MSKVEEILIEFGVNLEQDLQNSLASKMGSGYNARLSGKIKSLPIRHVGDMTQYILQMPLYGHALDKGRGPTVNDDGGELKKNLPDWIKRRGLVVKISKRKEAKLKNIKNKKIKKAYKQKTYEDAVKSLAYVIARKIHRKGYKGNMFFTEVINDGRLEKLTKDLIEATAQDIKIEFNK